MKNNYSQIYIIDSQFKTCIPAMYCTALFLHIRQHIYQRVYHPISVYWQIILNIGNI